MSFVRSLLLRCFLTYNAEYRIKNNTARRTMGVVWVGYKGGGVIRTRENVKNSNYHTSARVRLVTLFVESKGHQRTIKEAFNLC